MPDVSIKSPSSKLDISTQLLALGTTVGLCLIGVDIYAESQGIHEGIHFWVAKFCGHIGMAFLIGTIVGFGIDRLFHHKHLTEMSRQLEAALNTANASHEDELKKIIPETLSSMAAGKRLVQ